MFHTGKYAGRLQKYIVILQLKCKNTDMQIKTRKIFHYLCRRLLKDKLIILSGARQTGKTTLCKKILPKFLNKSFFYVSFDDPEERARFKENAILILENIKEEVVILDEVQKIPEILDSVKFVFDKQKDINKKRNLFILTGSCQLTLLHKTKETLAGRASILHLYPFSLEESIEIDKKSNFLTKILKNPKCIEDIKKDKILISAAQKRKIKLTQKEHQEWGSYPSVELHKEIADKVSWLKNYQITYLERDILDLGKVGDIDTFGRVQKMFATRAAQLFSLSEIAKELGLAVNTVKRYLHLLEISFQCFLLRPYLSNPSKRLIKTPKIYFADNGLLKTILGSLRIDEGHIYENWIFSEIIKWKKQKELEPEIYFYRTASGVEVDFIICQGDKTLALEVKQSKKIKENFARSILNLKKSNPEINLGIICYEGEEIKKIKEDIWAVPSWALFT